MPVVQVGGLSISYEERGLGEPVVLLHGLTFDARMWEAQFDPLAASHRVIAWDARDHGCSASAAADYDMNAFTDDLGGFLDALRIDRAHLVGLSMGGMTAMRFAARFPDRVLTLSLISTSAHREARAVRERYEQWLEQSAALPVSGFEADSIVALAFSTGFATEHPEVVATYRERTLAIPRDRLRRPSLSVVRRENVVDRLGSIRCPTLVVCGAEDVATPPRLSEALAAAILGSELVLLVGCGHLSAVERPDEVNAAVLRTLGR